VGILAVKCWREGAGKGMLRLDLLSFYAHALGRAMIEAGEGFDSLLCH